MFSSTQVLLLCMSCGHAYLPLNVGISLKICHSSLIFKYLLIISKFKAIWKFTAAQHLNFNLFKPGMRMPGFLKLFCSQMLCVSTPLRKLITIHVKYMRNNQITAFPFLYITLAMDKLNGRGLNNTVHCEHLPKKTKVTQY